MDEFHGRSERGGRQELHVRLNLIAMTRPFSGDTLLAEACEEGCENQAVNFMRAIVAANIEELILAQAEALAETAARTAEGILKVRSRIRRSYPGKSKKPASMWSR